MASFWATFGVVDNRAKSGGTQPVMQGRAQEGMTALTTSGASQIVQRAAVDWVAPDEGAVTMRADGNVWVMIAAAPVAAAAANFFLAANERMEFTVETGDKIAVINV